MLVTSIILVYPVMRPIPSRINCHVINHLFIHWRGQLKTALKIVRGKGVSAEAQTRISWSAKCVLVTTVISDLFV